MKKIWALLTMVAVATMTMVSGASASPFEVAQTYNDADTSNGILDLPPGIMLGGSPTNYITLLEDITVYVKKSQDPVVIEDGTLIDCDPLPGYPDPCDLS